MIAICVRRTSTRSGFVSVCISVLGSCMERLFSPLGLIFIASPVFSIFVHSPVTVVGGLDRAMLFGATGA